MRNARAAQKIGSGAAASHAMPTKEQRLTVQSRALYVGRLRPGELIHSFMRPPISACLARRISLSRSTPGGVPWACFRRRCASSARRLSSGRSCLNWSGIGATPLAKAGAQLAFSSPVEAAGCAVTSERCALFGGLAREIFAIPGSAWGTTGPRTVSRRTIG
jgi:hypothetical protein